MTINKVSFVWAMLLLLSVGGLCMAQQIVPTDLQPRIDIGRVKAQEGSNFFTIEVECSLHDADVRPRHTPCTILAGDATDFIQVEPQVTFQLVAGSGRFRLVGAFAPRTHYRLTFLPGLRAEHQAALQTRIEKTVRTPGLSATLRFLGRARYLPPLHGASLPFEARNVTRLRVSYLQIYPENLTFWLTKNQEAASPDVADEVHHVEMHVEAKLDEQVSGQIDLDVLSRFGQGVFQIAVDHLPQDHSRSRLDSATLVITDIVALAKYDNDDLYVWTRSATDMRAKPGVHVRLMSVSNREIASCTTSGADGACILTGVMRQQRKPLALILTQGSDLSYLRFTDVEVVDDRVHAGRRPYREEGVMLDAYVYSARGVYRPGETVHLGAVVWTTTRHAAQRLPLQWQILTPRNKVLKEVSTRSSAFGMTTLEVKLDAFTPTGKYHALLKSGDTQLQRYGFFVEDFVPERIGIKVAPQHEAFTGTDLAAFDIAAHYLFGPPVAAGQYTLRCMLQPAWFTVPGHAAFSTGVYMPQPARPLVLEPAIGQLDADGQATASCAYERFLSAFPTVMQVKADVEIAEAGSGRVTLKSGTALASAYDVILGLRTLRAAGKQIHVEGKLFSPSGEEIRRDAQVSVSWYRVENNWNYLWDPEQGHYRWQREELLLAEGGPVAMALHQGRFDAMVNAQHPYGAYVVRARLVDTEVVADVKVSLGYTWFWQASSDGNTPKPPSPDQIRVLLSSTVAGAGEDIQVRFDAPFAGHLLLAVEADRLLDSRWIEIDKGPQEFVITAPDLLPNAYVSVLLLKHPVEGGYYVPARAWGSATLHITPVAHTMQIDVDAPDTLRPQSDLEITLRAHPTAPTQFTVAVVDEGILQLTDFRTPDPLGYFFQARRLGVHTFETVGWTFARKLGTQDPGGGVGRAGVRPAVVPVIIVSQWTGMVDSDARGTAVVRVPIPQFQGKLRVMVVGVSAGRVGHTERFVTVRDPLVVQATLPRFLVRDDAFSIPVLVVNTTGDTQDVQVELHANEAIVLAQSTARDRIAHLQSRLFQFEARVQSFTGTASLTVTAAGGSFATRDTINVPIIPLTPEKTVTATVQAGKDIPLGSILPPDVRAEELRLDVAVSTIPFLQELSQLRYVLHYPYGCIEQTTSGTFPLLYVSDLLDWVDPDLLKNRDVTDMVYAGLNRLISMQTTSGGFGYWPGHNEPTLWGTAYVTHLLLSAKALGYDVSNSTINAALDFLHEAVTSRRHAYDRRRGNQLTSAEPYMLYVLGLAGRHQIARLRQLAQRPPQWRELTAENDFLVMLTYYLAGDRQAYETYARRQALLQPTTAARHYGGTFWSSLRTDAMRLSLAEDANLADLDLEPLAQRVANVMQSRPYLSTQELSWSVSALGKRARRYRGVDLASVTLQLDGQTIAPTIRHRDAPVWTLSGSPFATQTLRITHSGETAPPVYVKMRGYLRPDATLQAAVLPFALSRRYLTLRGEPLDAQRLMQGELAVVELLIESATQEEIPNTAIVDRLPAGLEIENPRLGRGHQLDWIPEDGRFEPDYLDLRDDRIQIFGALPRRGRHDAPATRLFYYVVRAVTPGEFTAPPARLEVMYDPQQVFYTDYERLTIQRP